MKAITVLKLLAICLLLTGCAQYENKRGVDVTWEPAAMGQLEKGKTTRAEVLTLLGPPSQVLSLGDESALYYLFERSEGNGLVLILYNRMEVDTRYDRAIFLFDENDILTEYSSRTHDGDE